MIFMVVKICPIVVSLIAIAVSVYTLGQCKKDSFREIASLVFSTKEFYLEMYATYGDKYKCDKYARYIINEAASNYCNSLEHACALYLNGGMNQKLFKTVFRSEVDTVFHRKGVAVFLDEEDMMPGNETYANIKAVRNKWFL